MTLHPIRPPDWAARAACAGLAHPWHDPWYPESGGDVGQSVIYAEARAICEQCPVHRPCLAEAMSEESGLGLAARHGVRAGTTPRQRWEADPNRPPAKNQAEEAA